MRVDVFLDKLKTYYDGYAFSHDDSMTVYNPVSINNFFLENEFDDYWIQTGQHEFVGEYISKNKITV
jgi:hypothetical protein